jgi:hypothetical protein
MEVRERPLVSKTSDGIFDGSEVDRKSDTIKMPGLPAPFTEKPIPELATRHCPLQAWLRREMASDRQR